MYSCNRGSEKHSEIGEFHASCFTFFIQGTLYSHNYCIVKFISRCFLRNMPSLTKYHANSINLGIACEEIVLGARSHLYTSWKFKILLKNIGKCPLPSLSPEWRISVEHFV
jgi:hypothetical protein